MRNAMILFAAALMLLSAAIVQPAKSECDCNAQVRKVQGLDIYLYSEPTREYEVTLDFSSDVGVLGAIADTNTDIDNIVQSFVNKAKRKMNKKNSEVEMDGIIIVSNLQASGIKYVE